jgi:hypothetical protein
MGEFFHAHRHMSRISFTIDESKKVAYIWFDVRGVKWAISMGEIQADITRVFETIAVLKGIGLVHSVMLQVSGPRTTEMVKLPECFQTIIYTELL